jgi:hypothetical protein
MTDGSVASPGTNLLRDGTLTVTRVSYTSESRATEAGPPAQFDLHRHRGNT